MKKLLIPALVLLTFSCGKATYPTNGETIYKTGRNLKGERLLDRDASRITIVNSCRFCHGNHGDAMARVNISWAALSSPGRLNPYTKDLFFRFLDEDLKSDGTHANIGVIWKMSDGDKEDLMGYLRTL